MNRISIPRAFALVAVSLSLLTLVIAAGSSSDAAAQVATAPPEVSVAGVVSRPVMEYDEFTGRIEAVERVAVRPRVSGYIAAVQFQEGAEIRKGDVLFVIDFLQVLDAERTLRGAQDLLAQSRTATATSRVAVYKALGGGWESGTAAR